jgi:hypothetical protein
MTWHFHDGNPHGNSRGVWRVALDPFGLQNPFMSLGGIFPIPPEEYGFRNPYEPNVWVKDIGEGPGGIKARMVLTEVDDRILIHVFKNVETTLITMPCGNPACYSVSRGGFDFRLETP